jgi:hypothetical protein
MHPPMGGWPPGGHNLQGTASPVPASQLFSQLNQLYTELQIFYPEWCQQNSFWSLIEGRSDAQLFEHSINWTKAVQEKLFALDSTV